MLNRVPIDITTTNGAAFMRRYFKKRTVISVPVTKAMTEGMCYSNVRQLVTEHGGKPIWGWRLDQVGTAFMEAMHHAIWEDPSGGLHDVTPISSGKKLDNILFVRDFETRVTPYDPGVPSKFLALRQSASVNEWIELNRTRMKIMREALDIMLSKRHVVLSNGSIGLREPPPVELMNRLKTIEELRIRSGPVWNMMEAEG